jgi:segregation and condensation protein B
MSGQAQTLPQTDAQDAADADTAGLHVDVPAVEASPVADPALLKKILEAALLTAQEPLTLAEMKKFSEETVDNAFIEGVLAEIAQDYADSGIELNHVSSGWRFRARPEMQPHLDKLNPQKQPRYSRAVMETLAIIAYRQPVTRGDIEEIRGVAVSSNVLKTLEARGWIDVVGTRDVPGKPSLYATTKQLLDDLNLRSLQELPSLEDMGGLLEQGITPDQPSLPGLEKPKVTHEPELEPDPSGQASLLEQGEAVAAAPEEDEPLAESGQQEAHQQPGQGDQAGA